MPIINLVILRPFTIIELYDIVVTLLPNTTFIVVYLRQFPELTRGHGKVNIHSLLILNLHYQNDIDGNILGGLFNYFFFFQ